MGHFVVVGGSKGIGFGITQHLVNEGHLVTVLSRSGNNLEGLEGVEHVEVDVTKNDVSSDILPGEISGLAYCPGTINLRSFRSLKTDAFLEDFELNVLGAVKTIQASLKGLKKASPSSIVLFSTVAVGQGMPMHASVAASKGALEGLARTLAAELSPDTRVNCIAPALTETSLTERFFSDEQKSAALAQRYPLQRTGTVQDIASMAHFLLTDKSTWITGQTLGVDGGMSTIRS